MKIGIAGFGSIGKRHLVNLLALGENDVTLFREKGSGNEYHLEEIYNFEEFSSLDYDLVIISNPATSHLSTAMPFIKNNINLFIEKPVVATSGQMEILEASLSDYTGISMVGYNLRFHPCIQKIKSIIGSGLVGNIYSARFFVGQYLPDWRPGQDYRQGVSSLKSLGGGVILELIHEVDLAVYLFGKPGGKINSVAGRLSDLEIEVEDISEILYLSDKGIIVSIHQDYLSRSYRRTIEIVGELGSVYCDLKESEIRISGENMRELYYEKFSFERNDMYLSMMRNLICCVKSGARAYPDIMDSIVSLKIAFEAIKEL